MQPTYEELFTQVEVLTRLLEEALAENKILKAKVKELYTEGVEPTNNVAERSLRFGVIWRKLSYGTQSESGERFVERVMTVAMTLKLRAKNSFEYFTECFKALIHSGQSPPVFSI